MDVELGEQKSADPALSRRRALEIQRDARTETAALKRLEAAGFAPAQKIRRHAPARHSQDFLPVDDDEFAWFDALYHELPRLKDEGWIIEIAPDFPVRLLGGAGDIDASIRESSGIDWLELDLGVVVDGETIDLVQPIVAMIGAKVSIQRLRPSRRRCEPFYLASPTAGSSRCPKRGSRRSSRRSTNSPVAARSAAKTENCACRRSTPPASPPSRKRRSPPGSSGAAARSCAKWAANSPQAAAFRAVALPEMFTATLRPYQAQGVAWLAFLRDVGLGGVLADDMGLGKTVQALALIAIEKAGGRLDDARAGDCADEPDGQLAARGGEIRSGFEAF